MKVGFVAVFMDITRRALPDKPPFAQPKKTAIKIAFMKIHNLGKDCEVDKMMMVY